MCLSVAIKYPDDVLARGVHAGHEWIVTHNGMGYRCGYVRIGPDHPWHGKRTDDLVDVQVHGGLTFAEPDVACDKGDKKDGWWVGWDAGHAWDLPDMTLPIDPRFREAAEQTLRWGRGMEVRTQEYVEAECRSLCEQAAAALAPT